MKSDDIEKDEIRLRYVLSHGAVLTLFESQIEDAREKGILEFQPDVKVRIHFFPMLLIF